MKKAGKLLTLALTATVMITTGCAPQHTPGVITKSEINTDAQAVFTENTEMTEAEITEINKLALTLDEKDIQGLDAFTVKTADRGADVTIDMLLMHPKAAKRAKFWGIKTADELVNAGSSPTKRWFLTRKLGGLFPSQAFKTQVLVWVERADLLRVKNVSVQDSTLLIMAGVTSAPHLAIFNNPFDQAALKVQLSLLAFQYGYPIPSLEKIESWTQDAGTLPPILY